MLPTEWSVHQEFRCNHLLSLTRRIPFLIYNIATKKNGEGKLMNRTLIFLASGLSIAYAGTVTMAWAVPVGQTAVVKAENNHPAKLPYVIPTDGFILDTSDLVFQNAQQKAVSPDYIEISISRNAKVKQLADGTLVGIESYCVPWRDGVRKYNLSKTTSFQKLNHHTPPFPGFKKDDKWMVHIYKVVQTKSGPKIPGRNGTYSVDTDGTFYPLWQARLLVK
jgi:hypothetical protein